MNERFAAMAENAAAGAALLAMAGTGAFLLYRLIRVLRGEETVDGLSSGSGHASGRAMLLAGAAAILSRLLLYALAYGLYRGMNYGSSGFTETFRWLWQHWDTQHYIGIAEEGYTAVGNERLRLVFFPLYPWLMRLGAVLTGGDVFLSGILISLCCSGISAALLTDLCWPYGGRDTAVLANAYFLLNPLSVFLGCVYTESLFIALTLGVMVLTRRGHPWLAALCGGASALTRMPGVIAAGIPLIALLGKLGRNKARPLDAAACAGQMALIFSGLGIYWLINLKVAGDPFTYMVYQKENWFQAPGWFFQSASNSMHYFLTSAGEPDHWWTWGFQLIAMGVVYLLLLLGQKALPFDLAAYSYVYTAVVLSPTWLLSGARYLYALAPLPLLLSRLHRKAWLHTLMLSVTAGLLIVWVYGYTLAIEVL